MALDPSYNAKNYEGQGGDNWHVGGTFDVESGGSLDIKSGGALKIGGTAVTATAAQLNALLPIATATVNEVDTLAGLPASITTAATPASGTCGVQFVFKDAAGAALAHAIAGHAYFSNSTGLAIAAATSGATLTNGDWLDTVAGKTGHFVTDATGKLGVTVTGGAATYYITFQLPNGKLVTSSALVVN